MKMVQALWETVLSVPQRIKTELWDGPAVPLLGAYSKNEAEANRCLYSVSMALFPAARRYVATQVPLTDERRDKMYVVYTYSGISFSLIR